jgi:hypothetical protein
VSKPPIRSHFYREVPFIAHLKGYAVAESNVGRAESAARKPKDHFAAAIERDAGLRKEQEASRAANLAKMARLKALRLARDSEQEVVTQTKAEGTAARRPSGEAHSPTKRRKKSPE